MSLKDVVLEIAEEMELAEVNRKPTPILSWAKALRRAVKAAEGNPAPALSPANLRTPAEMHRAMIDAARAEFAGRVPERPPLPNIPPEESWAGMATMMEGGPLDNTWVMVPSSTLIGTVRDGYRLEKSEGRQRLVWAGGGEPGAKDE